MRRENGWATKRLVQGKVGSCQETCLRKSGWVNMRLVQGILYDPPREEFNWVGGANVSRPPYYI